MRAFPTHRDHALSLTVWLVILSQTIVLAVLAGLHGIPTGLHGSTLTIVIACALIATCAALATGHRLLAVGFGGSALICELVNLPTGKLPILIAGLHAAHVAAGLLLVAWLIALAPRHRGNLPRLIARYWYLVTATYVCVATLIV